MDVYGYFLDDPINFHDRTGFAGKSEGKEQGTYSKIASGLHKAAIAIPKGLEKTADKSTEGIKKATIEDGKAASKAIVKGSHVAKEAIEKAADEFKNNKELQKYTGIALGAGAVPIALAGGAAVASTEAGAAIGEMAYSTGKKALKESKTIFRDAEKIGKKVFKASDKKLYHGLDKIEQSVGTENVKDFISAFNAGELPSVTSWGGGIGGILAGKDELHENTNKLIKYLKSKK
ncbi:hypothetical protein [Desulfovibrio gilichinskyi]|uniref:Pre-toxin TG domain-containing protein n=1 Tax=Desulfovibrio gilichinskyi TaxID=1519643 RepID=A0A1X7DXH0_9BACT|nr:hypothetical protein [Desulfovibrio gilichinskyi]SMF23537.1 hypothetical protein SAMN06295933_2332 [Desulfovibrio gilichinskyi]